MSDDLAEKIENIISDMWYPDIPNREVAERIVDQLPHLLYQDGWLTPAAAAAIRDWSWRASTTLPTSPSFTEHPGDVLISWLTELAGLMHQR